MSANMAERKKAHQIDAMSGKKMFAFLGDVKIELKKISWTSKEELQAYTKIVIAATFLFGLVIYFMDVLIQQCLLTINVALRFITG